MAFALVGQGLSILGVGETEGQATEDARGNGYSELDIATASIERCSRTLLEQGGGTPEQVWRGSDGRLHHDLERETFMVLRPTLIHTELSPRPGQIVKCGHERHTRKAAEECRRGQIRHGAIHDEIVWIDADGRIRTPPAEDCDA